MMYRLTGCVVVLATGCLTAEPEDTGGGGGGKGDIWGADDRIERFEIQTEALRQASLRTVAFVQTSALQLDAARATYSVPRARSLGVAQNL